MKLISSVFAAVGLLLWNMAVLADSDYKKITWEDLIPKDAIQPEQYSLDELHNLDQILVQQEENAEIVGRQVVPELAGKKVKLPAYVIPLDSDSESIKEFLLVPYFGACIHVPPPPPNQIVFGAKNDGIKISLFDAIWAYGTIQIETIDSELAESGYSMKVDKMTPIDWKEFLGEEKYNQITDW
ncbi:MAG: DUF3299 domain-containing protein [Thiotrichales bacterium]|nr:DUF3299 domain-containing protein [Thiotrichales bacterium]